MFKYKSPLSRLLEGAGKAKEDEGTDPEVEQAEKAEPIADFNALRHALAGGNLSSDSYEDAEQLIPEEKMPGFDDGDTAEELQPENNPEPEVTDIADEGEEEQVVTLHVAVTDDEDKTENVLATVAEAVAPEADASEVDDSGSDLAPFVTPDPISAEPERVQEPEVAEEPSAEPETSTSVAAAPVPTEDRRSRVKTTFLGFEHADTHVQDLIETAEPIARSEAAGESFPVGWLVVTSGPGRGASITVKEGLMQIGRNDDQAIQLDFGDTGISRSNHAVIAYDPEDRKCYLGHGGKANLVRLNGKPVLSTVPLSGGDLIRISETSIRFIPFCDDSFDWRDA
ncbi:MAG: FHA domain-containing protein [Ruegeria sp.]